MIVDGAGREVLGGGGVLPVDVGAISLAGVQGFF